VVDPLGVKLMDLGTGNRVGFYQTEEDRIAKAREILPLLKQVRVTAYGPCAHL
jgi:hypothetical protein